MISSSQFRHWATVIARKAIHDFGDSHVVCTGWSPSGTYHIGNSRESITCNAVHKSLLKLGAESKFVFVIDDFDPLDKIPENLKKFKRDLKPFLGHPINRVPDFTETHDSYAEYFSSGAIEAMSDFGFDTEFLYASQLYKEGRYDDFVRTYYEKSAEVDALFTEITGSPLSSYVSVICQNCGNLKTPQVVKFDGDQFDYKCVSEKMYRGCDNNGTISIHTNEWKLKWRLDWPSRQTFLKVTVEPSGKDHSVAGGSIDTANAIHSKILNHQGPLLERYGFITLGGRKLSGSKGGTLPASSVSNIMPASAYLFLVYRADLLKDFDFNYASNEYGRLLDEFDVGRSMLLGKEFEGREREYEKLSTAAELAMFESEKGFIPANVKFDELSLIYQISLRDIDITIDKLDQMNKFPNDNAKREIRERLKLLEEWLNNFAPANAIFKIHKVPQPGIEEFWSSDIIQLWKDCLAKLTSDMTSKEFAEMLKTKAQTMGLKPKDYYQPFYLMLTGDKKGPNAANLILTIGIDQISAMIQEIEKRQR